MFAFPGVVATWQNHGRRLHGVMIVSVHHTVEITGIHERLTRHIVKQGGASAMGSHVEMSWLLLSQASSRIPVVLRKLQLPVAFSHPSRYLQLAIVGQVAPPAPKTKLRGSPGCKYPVKGIGKTVTTL